MTTSLRQRFAELHAVGTFVMPNPWDVGSARLLESLGFPALATTSAGYAASIGRRRPAAHARRAAGARRDARRRHRRAPERRRRAPVRRRARGGRRDGAADRGHGSGRVLDRGLRPRARAARSAGRGGGARRCRGRGRDGTRADPDRARGEPPVRRRRPRRHDRPPAGLPRGGRARRVRAGAGAASTTSPAWCGRPACPSTCSRCATGLPCASSRRRGVRRVSTGGALAFAAYGALVHAGQELLESGTSEYTAGTVPRELRQSAFGR